MGASTPHSEYILKWKIPKKFSFHIWVLRAKTDFAHFWLWYDLGLMCYFFWRYRRWYFISWGVSFELTFLAIAENEVCFAGWVMCHKHISTLVMYTFEHFSFEKNFWDYFMKNPSTSLVFSSAQSVKSYSYYCHKFSLWVQRASNFTHQKSS